MSGIRHGDYLSQYQDKSNTLNLAAADTPTTVGAGFLAGKAGYTLMVRKLTVHVRTAAAQALTFVDTGAAPFELAVLPASAAVGDEHVLIDAQDGPGIPLTEGADLDITGAAGVEATIHCQAYLKPTGVLVAGSRTTTTV